MRREVIMSVGKDGGLDYHFIAQNTASGISACVNLRGNRFDNNTAAAEGWLLEGLRGWVHSIPLSEGGAVMAETTGHDPETRRLKLSKEFTSVLMQDYRAGVTWDFK
jgi:hypothetical protein